MVRVLIAAFMFILSGVAPVGADDIPRLRFIPICESLPNGSGSIDCIPQTQVDNQEMLKAWKAASLQLNKCEKVLIDPEAPMVATNIGFLCNGILTGSGVVPTAPVE